MSLLISLRSEALKTKRTAAFYFTLIGAAIVPLIYLLNVFTDGLSDTKKDPLNAILRLNGEMNGFAFFPLFVVLVCTLLPQIEHRNNTWKQVLTAPRSKATVFVAKLLNVQLLLLLFLVANHVFIFLAIVIAHFADPSVGLLHQPLNGTVVLTRAANTYITISALCAAQFWMGLRFRNFIVPTAIGLAFWLTGTLMVLEYHSRAAEYFPYSFQLFGIMPNLRPQLVQVVWTSLAYGAVFLLLGYWDFSRRRMHQ